MTLTFKIREITFQMSMSVLWDCLNTAVLRLCAAIARDHTVVLVNRDILEMDELVKVN